MKSCHPQSCLHRQLENNNIALFYIRQTCEEQTAGSGAAQNPTVSYPSKNFMHNFILLLTDEDTNHDNNITC